MARLALAATFSVVVTVAVTPPEGLTLERSVVSPSAVTRTEPVPDTVLVVIWLAAMVNSPLLTESVPRPESTTPVKLTEAGTVIV